MAHKILLEGQKAFDKEYVIKPDGMNFSTKAGKEWRDSFSSDTNFVKNKDVQKVKMLRKIFDQVPEYKNIIDDGLPEVTLIWTEEIEGVKVKCAARCDKLGKNGIVDLKTFSNEYGFAVNEAVGRAIGNYKYFIQRQWYIRGIKALKAKGLCKDIAEKFTFLFVQSDGIPNIIIRHTDTINGMIPAYMRQGDLYIEKAFRVFSQNMKSHGWGSPWFSKDIRILLDDDIPNYAIDKEV